MKKPNIHQGLQRSSHPQLAVYKYRVTLSLVAFAALGITLAFGPSPSQPQPTGFRIVSKNLNIDSFPSCRLDNSVASRTIRWEAETRVSEVAAMVSVRSENYQESYQVADIYVQATQQDRVLGVVSRQMDCATAYSLTTSMRSQHTARSNPDARGNQIYLDESNQLTVRGL
jgi:hypothetical protein